MFTKSRSARFLTQPRQLRAAVVSTSMILSITGGTGTGSGTITITSITGEGRCG